MFTIVMTSFGGTALLVWWYFFNGPDDARTGAYMLWAVFLFAATVKLLAPKKRTYRNEHGIPSDISHDPTDEDEKELDFRPGYMDTQQYKIADEIWRHYFTYAENADKEAEWFMSFIRRVQSGEEPLNAAFNACDEFDLLTD